ncbi:carbon-nitrogen hydrolase family protein [Stackebrandtia nassauensis]|uniref:Nitrilase/cyanide hydratase and apolipoprotein N-acyltransferase n=1 Tax=Stackebrandtia nassauensis (strain DSM 44728 / CIP 108903 / NRRL B-16338 / NBRC 102104 / LLR-40K-21) TaxID=446470 RepID=D3Q7F6_STANL|nr:carbon-nitrogen hydrolase family protein [Stackebrandtia nassauensis]ADD42427.1 Nitrilase/cyanide hydratase and apolipoprotein N- acyltransferase [Stackebrandtia nassauensis DSM 44728]
MTEPGTLLVGCVQMRSDLDPGENLRQCLRYLDEARTAGVDLLIFPETVSSRVDDPSRAPQAESLDDGFVAGLAKATEGLDLTVIAGVTETHDDRPFNTLVALRDGQRVARYRKIHLYDACAMAESDTIAPGDGPVSTFAVKGFEVGMMTCYDIRFPELSRLLAERGADLLAVPTSWVRGPLKEEHWTTFCKARALENTVYLAGACQTGGSRVGLTSVVAPDGVIVSRLAQHEGLVTARIGRDALTAAREAFPLLEQRRFAISPEITPHPTAD